MMLNERHILSQLLPGLAATESVAVGPGDDCAALRTSGGGPLLLAAVDQVIAGVHFLSEEATELYEAARERIAAFVGAAAKEEIVFTAGATASLNTVAYAWGDAFVGVGDNILVSEMEHH